MIFCVEDDTSIRDILVYEKKNLNSILFENTVRLFIYLTFFQFFRDFRPFFQSRGRRGRRKGR